MQIRPPIHPLKLIGPVLVAIMYICACSFFREPNRRNFNAIMMAGAGAAYLNGGFGVWEFAFTSLVTYFAYKGFDCTTSSESDGFYILVGMCSIISTEPPSCLSPQLLHSDAQFAIR
jgi:hypothetical protein